jgi:hypothetical protein
MKQKRVIHGQSSIDRNDTSITEVDTVKKKNNKTKTDRTKGN